MIPDADLARARARLAEVVGAGEAGGIVAVQRIWCVDRIGYVAGGIVYLNDDGTEGAAAKDARAPIEVRKKTLGRMGTGAVRLAPAGPVLGLAEGVETAIAASMLYRLPVWATCGLSRLGYPAHWSEPRDGSKPCWIEERPPSIWIPPEVRQLFIFGDRGSIGETVASFAADWWHARGVSTAQAVFPDAGYGDFNDQLLGRMTAA